MLRRIEFPAGRTCWRVGVGLTQHAEIAVVHAFDSHRGLLAAITDRGSVMGQVAILAVVDDHRCPVSLHLTVNMI